MGDHVNLASRLEGLNKYYGTNIIITQDTYTHCTECSGKNWTVRELDTVRVKGKHEPVTIYEVVATNRSTPQNRPLSIPFTRAWKHTSSATGLRRSNVLGNPKSLIQPISLHISTSPAAQNFWTIRLLKIGTA